MIFAFDFCAFGVVTKKKKKKKEKRKKKGKKKSTPPPAFAICGLINDGHSD